MFVSVYERATGTPIVAVGMMSGFGETVAPRIVAVSVNGAESRVRGPAGVDRDLPDAGLRVGDRAARRAAG